VKVFRTLMLTFTALYFSASLSVQAQTPPGELAENFLLDIKSMASAARSNNKEWSKPLLNNPKLGNAVLRYAIMYGDVTWQIKEIQIANDAARVHLVLTFNDYQQYSWPARIDFMSKDGEWFVRETRLLTLRPLDPQASPDLVLKTYLANMKKYAAVITSAKNKKTVRFAQLQREWGKGAGYWGLTPECRPPPHEPGCSPFPFGNNNIFAKMLAWGDEGDFRVSAVKPDGPDFIAMLSAKKKRRTYTSTADWELRLHHHYRYGWQLTNSELQGRTIPTPVNIEPFISGSEVEFIKNILNVFFSSERQEISNMGTFFEQTKIYFVDTRFGRKALGRLMASRAMIVRTPAEDWVITKSGPDKFKASRKDESLRPKSLIFQVVGEPGSYKISNLEIRL